MTYLQAVAMFYHEPGGDRPSDAELIEELGTFLEGKGLVEEFRAWDEKHVTGAVPDEPPEGDDEDPDEDDLVEEEFDEEEEEEEEGEGVYLNPAFLDEL